MKNDDRLIERLVALLASGRCNPGQSMIGVPPGAADDPIAIAAEAPGSAGRRKIKPLPLDATEAKRERAAQVISLALSYGRAAQSAGTHIPPCVADELKALACAGDLAATAVMQWCLRHRVIGLTVVPRSLNFCIEVGARAMIDDHAFRYLLARQQRDRQAIALQSDGRKQWLVAAPMASAGGRELVRFTRGPEIDRLASNVAARRKHGDSLTCAECGRGSGSCPADSPSGLHSTRSMSMIRTSPTPFMTLWAGLDQTRTHVCRRTITATSSLKNWSPRCVLLPSPSLLMNSQSHCSWRRRSRSLS